MFTHEGRLWVLFGDTWQGDTKETRDMGVKLDGLAIADDALGFVSLTDFPNGSAVERFITAHPAKLMRTLLSAN